jgi:hypothetical protein
MGERGRSPQPAQSQYDSISFYAIRIHSLKSVLKVRKKEYRRHNCETLEM